MDNKQKFKFNKAILPISLFVIIAIVVFVFLSKTPLNIFKSSTNEAESSDATVCEVPIDIENKKALVLYFSRAENIIDAEEYYKTLENDIDAMTSASVSKTEDGELTGNVGLLARWIAENVDGDLYSIKVKEKYPQSKKETQKIVLQEQLEGVFPEVISDGENFEEYEIVYLGFPNWYAEPPRALYDFFEKNDFDGKIIIPFTSDDKNGFSDSVDIFKSKLPNSIVLSEEEGLLVNRKDVFEAEDRVKVWVEEVKSTIVAEKNNPNNVSGQKEAAIALIGQSLTPKEIEEKVGEYIKFAKGTNG